MSVYSPYKKFLLSACGALLIGATVFSVSTQAGAKDAKNLSPMGGWSVAKFSGGEASADSYCALTRSYSQDMVLTLGQNMAEEYSLAIDFQDAHLNTDKAYSITLQPGPSQIRAYEMMPASKKALVIRLGYDNSFISALKGSKMLKAEIDKVPYHFEVSDLSGGLKDLDSCLAGIKGGASTTKVASAGFSAEKVDEKLPPIEVKKEPIAQKVIKPVVKEAEVAKEVKKVKKVEETKEKAQEVVAQVPPPAVPTPIKVETAKVAQKVEKAEAQKAASPVKSAKAAVKTSPVTKEKSESRAFSRSNFNSPRVSRAIEISKADSREVRVAKTAAKEAKPLKEMPANPPPVVKPEKVQDMSRKIAVAEQTRLQKKQRAEIEQLRQDNERLNEALRTQVSRAESKKTKTTPEDIQKKAEQLRLEKERYKEIERLRKNLEDIRSENEQLKLAAKAGSIKMDMPEEPPVQKINEDTDQKETLMAQIVNLRTENQRLSAALQSQKTLESAAPSKEVETKLAAMQARMQELEAENQKLASETKQVRSKTDTAVVDMGSQAFKRIREYEKRLEAAQQDNLMLSRELEELRRMKEDVSLKSVAGDWDLEKATMRYNEAEREIKRLGMLLEQQRSIHRQEKGELEQMLFDPAVTEERQRQRLAELETRLAMAEGRLGRGVQSAGRALSGYAGAGYRGAGYTRPPMQERVAVGMTPMTGNAAATAAMPSVPAAPVRQATMTPPVQAPPIRNNVPRPPVPAMMPEPTPQQNFQQPPRSQAALSFNSGKLQTLLSRAGVTVSGGVSQQSPGIYRWGAGQLVGQAEVVPASGAGTLEGFTQSYIARAQQSCGGDFASVPGAVKSHLRAYEIACIGPSKSTSSSVVIVQQGTEYVAISHNASADNMDMAMDARDRILTSL
ncbi:MAG: hypothetical protein MRY79_09565 [Alphaproteobacteria bacterium]|nr:hypothetical protein [Alphaproteobacteria bacterium]